MCKPFCSNVNNVYNCFSNEPAFSLFYYKSINFTFSIFKTFSKESL